MSEVKHVKVAIPEEEFEAYITKYALTNGILKMKVIYSSTDDMVSESECKVIPRCFHGEGKEWHRTEDGAKKYAEIMRMKKIQSLEKQIEKLRKKEF